MKLSELINYPPDYLPEFFVQWDYISREQLSDLQTVLDKATREADMQAFLQSNPQAIVQHLGGGHGRWVIPQKRLGAEHVPDFVIGERHSFGFEWQVVEIESPSAKMFTKSGNPSTTLSHAIRQITDWRAWLRRNQDYASRPQIMSGLGLTDIDANSIGLILLGRRNEVDPSTSERRRQMCADLNIQIHSYDWLVSNMLGRIESLERAHTHRQN